MSPMDSIETSRLYGAKCNNCGAPSYKILFRAGVAQVHQIVRCTECGLVYAFPRNEANLEHYSVAAGTEEPLCEASPEVLRARNKLPDYQEIEPVLSDLLRGKGHIVEVGAYTGMLLQCFRATGWRATGIEPDGRAVEFGRHAYSIEFHNGTLKSANLADECADAVVMLHVIEHIDDPAADVRLVNRALRKGGIFVVETPTYDSMMYRLLGRRERNLSCNGHIFFYTEATLTRLLRDNGFSVVRVDKVGRTMSLARFLWNVGVMSKSKRIQTLLEQISSRTKLDRAFVHLNVRDIVRVYARKL